MQHTEKRKSDAYAISKPIENTSYDSIIRNIKQMIFEVEISTPLQSDKKVSLQQRVTTTDVSSSLTLPYVRNPFLASALHYLSMNDSAKEEPKKKKLLNSFLKILKVGSNKIEHSISPGFQFRYKDTPPINNTDTKIASVIATLIDMLKLSKTETSDPPAKEAMNNYLSPIPIRELLTVLTNVFIAYSTHESIAAQTYTIAHYFPANKPSTSTSAAHNSQTQSSFAEEHRSIRMEHHRSLMAVLGDIMSILSDIVTQHVHRLQSWTTDDNQCISRTITYSNSNDNNSHMIATPSEVTGIIHLCAEIASKVITSLLISAPETDNTTLSYKIMDVFTSFYNSKNMEHSTERGYGSYFDPFTGIFLFYYLHQIAGHLLLQAKKMVKISSDFSKAITPFLPEGHLGTTPEAQVVHDTTAPMRKIRDIIRHFRQEFMHKVLPSLVMRLLYDISDAAEDRVICGGKPIENSSSVGFSEAKAEFVQIIGSSCIHICDSFLSDNHTPSTFTDLQRRQYTRSRNNATNQLSNASMKQSTSQNSGDKDKSKPSQTSKTLPHIPSVSQLTHNVNEEPGTALIQQFSKNEGSSLKSMTNPAVPNPSNGVRIYCNITPQQQAIIQDCGRKVGQLYAALDAKSLMQMKKEFEGLVAANKNTNPTSMRGTSVGKKRSTEYTAAGLKGSPLSPKTPMSVKSRCTKSSSNSTTKDHIYHSKGETDDTMDDNTVEAVGRSYVVEQDEALCGVIEGYLTGLRTLTAFYRTIVECSIDVENNCDSGRRSSTKETPSILNKVEKYQKYIIQKSLLKMLSEATRAVFLLVWGTVDALSTNSASMSRRIELPSKHSLINDDESDSDFSDNLSEALSSLYYSDSSHYSENIPCNEGDALDAEKTIGRAFEVDTDTSLMAQGLVASLLNDEVPKAISDKYHHRFNIFLMARQVSISIIEDCAAIVARVNDIKSDFNYHPSLQLLLSSGEHEQTNCIAPASRHFISVSMHIEHSLKELMGPSGIHRLKKAINFLRTCDVGTSRNVGGNQNSRLNIAMNALSSPSSPCHLRGLLGDTQRHHIGMIMDRALFETFGEPSNVIGFALLLQKENSKLESNNSDQSTPPTIPPTVNDTFLQLWATVAGSVIEPFYGYRILRREGLISQDEIKKNKSGEPLNQKDIEAMYQHRYTAVLKNVSIKDLLTTATEPRIESVMTCLQWLFASLSSYVAAPSPATSGLGAAAGCASGGAGVFGKEATSVYDTLSPIPTVLQCAQKCLPLIIETIDLTLAIKAEQEIMYKELSDRYADLQRGLILFERLEEEEISKRVTVAIDSDLGEDVFTQTFRSQLETKKNKRIQQWQMLERSIRRCAKKVVQIRTTCQYLIHYSLEISDTILGVFSNSHLAHNSYYTAHFGNATIGEESGTMAPDQCIHHLLSYIFLQHQTNPVGLGLTHYSRQLLMSVKDEELAFSSLSGANVIKEHDDNYEKARVAIVSAMEQDFTPWGIISGENFMQTLDSESDNDEEVQDAIDKLVMAPDESIVDITDLKTQVDIEKGKRKRRTLEEEVGRAPTVKRYTCQFSQSSLSSGSSEAEEDDELLPAEERNRRCFQKSDCDDSMDLSNDDSSVEQETNLNINTSLEVLSPSPSGNHMFPALSNTTRKLIYRVIKYRRREEKETHRLRESTVDFIKLVSSVSNNSVNKADSAQVEHTAPRGTFFWPKSHKGTSQTMDDLVTQKLLITLFGNERNVRANSNKKTVDKDSRDIKESGDSSVLPPWTAEDETSLLPKQLKVRPFNTSATMTPRSTIAHNRRTLFLGDDDTLLPSLPPLPFSTLPSYHLLHLHRARLIRHCRSIFRYYAQRVRVWLIEAERRRQTIRADLEAKVRVRMERKAVEMAAFGESTSLNNTTTNPSASISILPQQNSPSENLQNPCNRALISHISNEEDAAEFEEILFLNSQLLERPLFTFYDFCVHEPQYFGGATYHYNTLGQQTPRLNMTLLKKGSSNGITSSSETESSSSESASSNDDRGVYESHMPLSARRRALSLLQHHQQGSTDQRSGRRTSQYTDSNVTNSLDTSRLIQCQSRRRGSISNNSNWTYKGDYTQLLPIHKQPFFHNDHPVDFLLDPFQGCALNLLSSSAAYLEGDDEDALIVLEDDEDLTNEKIKSHLQQDVNGNFDTDDQHSQTAQLITENDVVSTKVRSEGHISTSRRSRLAEKTTAANSDFNIVRDMSTSVEYSISLHSNTGRSGELREMNKHISPGGSSKLSNATVNDSNYIESNTKSPASCSSPSNNSETPSCTGGNIPQDNVVRSLDQQETPSTLPLPTFLDKLFLNRDGLRSKIEQQLQRYYHRTHTVYLTPYVEEKFDSVKSQEKGDPSARHGGYLTYYEQDSSHTKRSLRAFRHQRSLRRLSILFICEELLAFLQEVISMGQRPTDSNTAVQAPSGASVHQNFNHDSMSLEPGNNYSYIYHNTSSVEGYGGGQIVGTHPSNALGLMLTGYTTTEDISAVSLVSPWLSTAGSPGEILLPGGINGGHSGGATKTQGTDTSLFVINPSLEELCVFSHQYSPLIARPKWKLTYFRFLYVLFLQQYMSKPFSVRPSSATCTSKWKPTDCNQSLSGSVPPKAPVQHNVSSSNLDTLINLDCSTEIYKVNVVENNETEADMPESPQKDLNDVYPIESPFLEIVAMQKELRRIILAERGLTLAVDDNLFNEEIIANRHHPIGKFWKKRVVAIIRDFMIKVAEKPKIEMNSVMSIEEVSYVHDNEEEIRIIAAEVDLLRTTFKEVMELLHRHTLNSYHYKHYLKPLETNTIARATQLLTARLLSTIRLMVEIDDESCMLSTSIEKDAKNATGVKSVVRAERKRYRYIRKASSVDNNNGNVSEKNTRKKHTKHNKLIKNVCSPRMGFTQSDMKSKGKGIVEAAISKAKAKAVKIDKATVREKAFQLGIVFTLIKEIDLEHTSKESQRRHMKRTQAVSAGIGMIGRTTVLGQGKGWRSVLSPANKFPDKSNKLETSLHQNASDRFDYIHDNELLGNHSVNGFGIVSLEDSNNQKEQTNTTPSPQEKKCVIPKLTIDKVPPPIYYTSSGDTAQATEALLINEEDRNSDDGTDSHRSSHLSDEGCESRSKTGIVGFSIPKLAFGKVPPPLYYTSSGDTAQAADAQMVNEDEHGESVDEEPESVAVPSKSPFTAMGFSIPKLAFGKVPPPLYYTSSGDTAQAADAQMVNEDEHGESVDEEPESVAVPSKSPFTAMGFSIPKLAFGKVPPPLYYTSSGDTAQAADAQMVNEDEHGESVDEEPESVAVPSKSPFTAMGFSIPKLAFGKIGNKEADQRLNSSQEKKHPPSVPLLNLLPSMKGSARKRGINNNELSKDTIQTDSDSEPRESVRNVQWTTDHSVEGDANSSRLSSSQCQNNSNQATPLALSASQSIKRLVPLLCLNPPILKSASKTDVDGAPFPSLKSGRKIQIVTRGNTESDTSDVFCESPGEAQSGSGRRPLPIIPRLVSNNDSARGSITPASRLSTQESGEETYRGEVSHRGSDDMRNNIGSLINNIDTSPISNDERDNVNKDQFSASGSESLNTFQAFVTPLEYYKSYDQSHKVSTVKPQEVNQPPRKQQDSSTDNKGSVVTAVIPSLLNTSIGDTSDSSFTLSFDKTSKGQQINHISVLEPSKTTFLSNNKTPKFHEAVVGAGANLRSTLNVLPGFNASPTSHKERSKTTENSQLSIMSALALSNTLASPTVEMFGSFVTSPFPSARQINPSATPRSLKNTSSSRQGNLSRQTSTVISANESFKNSGSSFTPNSGCVFSDQQTYPLQLLLDPGAFVAHQRQNSRNIYASTETHVELLYLLISLLVRGVNGVSFTPIEKSDISKSSRTTLQPHKNNVVNSFVSSLLPTLTPQQAQEVNSIRCRNATLGTLDDRYVAAFSILANTGGAANLPGQAAKGGAGNNILFPLHLHINHSLNQTVVATLQERIRRENLNQGISILLKLLVYPPKKATNPQPSRSNFKRIRIGNTEFLDQPSTPRKKSDQSGNEIKLIASTYLDVGDKGGSIHTAGATLGEANRSSNTEEPQFTLEARKIGAGAYGTVIASNLAVASHTLLSAYTVRESAVLDHEELCTSKSPQTSSMTKESSIAPIVNAVLGVDDSNNETALRNAQDESPSHKKKYDVRFLLTEDDDPDTHVLLPPSALEQESHNIATQLVSKATGNANTLKPLEPTKIPSSVALPLAIKLVNVPSHSDDRSALFGMHAEVLALTRCQDGSKHRWGISSLTSSVPQNSDNYLPITTQQTSRSGNCCELVDYGCTGSHYYIVMKRYPLTVKQWRERIDPENRRKYLRINKNKKPDSKITLATICGTDIDKKEAEKTKLNNNDEEIWISSSESEINSDDSNREDDCGNWDKHKRDFSDDDEYSSDEETYEERIERINKRRKMRKHNKVVETIHEAHETSMKKLTNKILEGRESSVKSRRNSGQAEFQCDEDKKVKSKGELTNPLLVTMFPVLASMYIEMIDSVLVMHQKHSIIHYDLKCDNFFLDFDNAAATIERSKEKVPQCVSEIGGYKYIDVDEWSADGSNATKAYNSSVKVRIGDFGECFFNPNPAPRPPMASSNSRLTGTAQIMATSISNKDEIKRSLSREGENPSSNIDRMYHHLTSNDKGSSVRYSAAMLADDYDNMESDLHDDVALGKLLDQYITHETEDDCEVLKGTHPNKGHKRSNRWQESDFDGGMDDECIEDGPGCEDQYVSEDEDVNETGRKGGRRNDSDSYDDRDDDEEASEKYHSSDYFSSDDDGERNPNVSTSDNQKDHSARNHNEHSQALPVGALNINVASQNRMNDNKRSGALSPNDPFLLASKMARNMFTHLELPKRGDKSSYAAREGLVHTESNNSQKLNTSENVRCLANKRLNKRNQELDKQYWNSHQVNGNGKANTSFDFTISMNTVNSTIMCLNDTNTNAPSGFGSVRVDASPSINPIKGFGSTYRNSLSISQTSVSKYPTNSTMLNYIVSARGTLKKSHTTNCGQSTKLDRRYARGTEAIRPPELLLAHKYLADRRRRAHRTGYESDVWACGCLLYELLTGDFLFREDTFAKMLHRVTHDQRGELLEERHEKMLNNDNDIIKFLKFVLCRDPQRRPLLTEVRRRFIILAKKKIIEFSGLMPLFSSEIPQDGTFMMPLKITREMLIPPECRRDALKEVLDDAMMKLQSSNTYRCKKTRSITTDTKQMQEHSNSVATALSSVLRPEYECCGRFLASIIVQMHLWVVALKSLTSPGLLERGSNKGKPSLSLPNMMAPLVPESVERYLAEVLTAYSSYSESNSTIAISHPVITVSSYLPIIGDGNAYSAPREKNIIDESDTFRETVMMNNKYDMKDNKKYSIIRELDALSMVVDGVDAAEEIKKISDRANNINPVLGIAIPAPVNTKANPTGGPTNLPLLVSVDPLQQQAGEAHQANPPFVNITNLVSVLTVAFDGTWMDDPTEDNRTSKGEAASDEVMVLDHIRVDPVSGRKYIVEEAVVTATDNITARIACAHEDALCRIEKKLGTYCDAAGTSCDLLDKGNASDHKDQESTEEPTLEMNLEDVEVNSCKKPHPSTVSVSYLQHHGFTHVLSFGPLPAAERHFHYLDAQTAILPENQRNPSGPGGIGISSNFSNIIPGNINSEVESKWCCQPPGNSSLNTDKKKSSNNLTSPNKGYSTRDGQTGNSLTAFIKNYHRSVATFLTKTTIMKFCQHAAEMYGRVLVVPLVPACVTVRIHLMAPKEIATKALIDLCKRRAAEAAAKQLDEDKPANDISSPTHSLAAAAASTVDGADLCLVWLLCYLSQTHHISLATALQHLTNVCPNFLHIDDSAKSINKGATHTDVESFCVVPYNKGIKEMKIVTAMNTFISGETALGLVRKSLPVTQSSVFVASLNMAAALQTIGGIVPQISSINRGLSFKTLFRDLPTLGTPKGVILAALDRILTDLYSKKRSTKSLSSRLETVVLVIRKFFHFQWHRCLCSGCVYATVDVIGGNTTVNNTLDAFIEPNDEMDEKSQFHNILNIESKRQKCGAILFGRALCGRGDSDDASLVTDEHIIPFAAILRRLHGEKAVKELYPPISIQAARISATINRIEVLAKLKLTAANKDIKNIDPDGSSTTANTPFISSSRILNCCSTISETTLPLRGDYSVPTMKGCAISTNITESVDSTTTSDIDHISVATPTTTVDTLQLMVKQVAPSLSDSDAERVRYIIADILRYVSCPWLIMSNAQRQHCVYSEWVVFSSRSGKGNSSESDLVTVAKCRMCRMPTHYYSNTPIPSTTSKTGRRSPMELDPASVTTLCPYLLRVEGSAGSDGSLHGSYNISDNTHEPRNIAWFTHQHLRPLSE